MSQENESGEFECFFVGIIFAVHDDHHHGDDGKDSEGSQGDGNTNEIGNEEQVFCAVLVVGFFVPDHNNVDNGCEDGGVESVNFRFGAVEPERVAEGEGEGADCSRQIGEQSTLGVRVGPAFIVLDEFNDDEIEHQNGEAAGDHRQIVDTEAHIVCRGEHGKKSAEYGHERRSGRVGYLHTECRRGDFAAVPE